LHHGRRFFVRERLELVHRAAGEERRVDLEVGVLGRRPDQRDEAVFHRVQDRVLLRLVETVDLVDEEDRPPAAAAEALFRPLEHGAHVVDPRRDGGQLLELGARVLGDDPRNRRLPASRWAMEDHRRNAVLLDREPERGPLAQDVFLPDELVERCGARAVRERCRLVPTLPGRIGEEVAHMARSMLTPRWRRPTLRTTPSRFSRAQLRPTTSDT
jgi:hypothetical protein